MLLNTGNLILASFSILAQILSLCLIITRLLPSRYNKDLNVLIKKHSLSFILIISLLASMGSLFYSEIIGFEPCKLCWWQRIFMYPQVILLSLALIKKESSVIKYSLAMSTFGLFISAYHYLMQIGFAPSLSCDATGASVSCSQNFVLEFGYISIPLMSFSAFLLIFLITLSKKRLMNKDF